MKKKILIVEDFAMISQFYGIGLLEKGFETEQSAANLKEIIDKIKSFTPDFVFFSMGLKFRRSFQFFLSVKVEIPIPVILYGDNITQAQIKEVYSSGASAYLGKNADLNELVHCIEALKTQKFYLDVNLHAESAKSDGDDLQGVTFTEREKEVIALLLQYKAEKNIADALHISMQTVKFHKKNIFRKANTVNTASLIAWLIENGY